MAIQPVREDITLEILHREILNFTLSDPKKLDEVYLQQLDWLYLSRDASMLRHSCDDRGEFFWFETYKIRPLPFLNFIVLGRDSMGKIISRRYVTLTEIFPTKLEDNI